MKLSIVILAAGQGKRMHSQKPKVLHSLAGKPLLEHVITTANAVNPNPPIVIYGHQGDIIRDALPHLNVQWVEQTSQLGTGHAVSQALPLIPDDHHVLILSGDVPLISETTLKKLMTETRDLGLVTANFPNPTGLGRVIRDAENNIIRIIEEKDANTNERTIHEINSGIYLTKASHLKKWLPQLNNQNAQQEFYLTDIIAFAAKENLSIQSVQPQHFQEVCGINDRIQLAYLERFYQRQYAEQLMRKGVTLLDPNRFDVRGELTVGIDAIIDVNVIFEGKVSLGNHCKIESNCILKNCVIGDNVVIKANTLIENAEIKSHSTIGPFARIRPETVIDEHVHIGNFVEIKKSTIGKSTKINHLSYVGDATIGESVNIGAGTITCNYDGFKKHRTEIGNRVQVGSDTTLVAPIKIHDDVYIATATTVRHDVPADALVFNKRTEEIREGWTSAKRAEQEIKEK